jgi:hypothetical protein
LKHVPIKLHFPVLSYFFVIHSRIFFRVVNRRRAAGVESSGSSSLALSFPGGGTNFCGDESAVPRQTF